jgi:chaperonin GroEL (HSP60 family)
MERRRALRVLRAVCGSTASLLGPVQALKALEDAAEPRLVADALGLLDLLDVQHPAAQLLHEAAVAQHAAHGAGTTQLLALIGSLCAEAETLERAGLSPATIARGFAEAAERCLAVADELAVDVEQLLVAGTFGPIDSTRSPRYCSLPQCASVCILTHATRKR